MDEKNMEQTNELSEQSLSEREAALDAREAELNRRELRAEAIARLTELGLPAELEQLIDYASPEACEASIELLERTFRQAVQQGVDERIRASRGCLPKGDAEQSGIVNKLRSAAGLDNN